LDAQRHHEIQQHVEECRSCRIELEKWESFEACLSEWEGPQISSDAIDSIKEASYEAFQSGDLKTIRFRPFIRRALATAAIILLTILFQSLIWNPFKPVIEYRTTLNLLPSMISLPIADAATSTTLFLTVHPNQMVSTQHLSGQYRLENIPEKLTEANLADRFNSVMIMGSDPENPVRLETDSLDDLQTSLGIDSVEIGPGLMALEIHDRFIGKLLYRAGTPSYPDLEMRPRTIQVDSTEVALRPGARMISGGISDYHSFHDLMSPSHATISVNEDTTLTLDRAIISVDMIDVFLRRLHAINDEVTLTILVQDKGSLNNIALELTRIAYQAGIQWVTITTVNP
jgi:hypothetical protein